jgi:hypothetical protein
MIPHLNLDLWQCAGGMLASVVLLAVILWR